MTDRQPNETVNLDRYGDVALPWSRARNLLESGPKGPLAGFFLGTVGPDGRPHVAGVGAVFDDGDLYFTSGPGTQKSRNLASNPACTIAVKFPDLDLTLEGKAQRVTDAANLERVATLYRELGWPAEGGRRCLHCPLQRAKRRPASLAPVPVPVPQRRWVEHRGAERGHQVALRLTRRPDPLD
jgi:hypothetical protein